MPIPLSCSCGKNYRLKDELAGKCVQCGRFHDLPAASSPAFVEDFEVVEDDPPESASPRAVRAAADVRRAEPPRRPLPRDDDDDRPVRHRRPRRRRSPRESSGGYSGISISPGVIAGLLMVLGAVVWFILGLFFGWIFFYPPILFILGLVRLIMSLMGREE
ncbi:MAG: hypothetical protein ACJ8F7_01045 [Gemmataceae bacterium]